MAGREKITKRQNRLNESAMGVELGFVCVPVVASVDSMCSIRCDPSVGRSFAGGGDLY